MSEHKLNEDVKKNLAAAAEAREAKNAALKEERELIEARKNDPTFASLSKELSSNYKQKVGEKAEKESREALKAATSSIATAAIERENKRKEYIETQKAIEERKATGVPFSKHELKVKAETVENKINNKVAKETIAERDTNNPAIKEALNQLKKN